MKKEDDIYDINWKLVNENGSTPQLSKDIKWIEWDKNGNFEKDHSNPDIGYSLIMSPFNAFYTWMTSRITEVIVERSDYVKFKTVNSTYELFKLNHKEDE